MLSRSKTIDKLLQYRAWILVALTILLVAAVRVRLRDMPLERDEGEYAYAGQLILQGVPPYQQAYNMKLPGTYAAYAVIMAVFGQTQSGIHSGLMLVNTASIVLVFLLGRRLLDEVAGVAAALVFALLSLSPSTLGLAAHSSHFVVCFALAGTLVLIRAVSSIQYPETGPRARRSTLDARHLLLSGLLFGLAFLMDQHGVFFGIFAGIYLLWISFGDRLAPRGNRRKETPTQRRTPINTLDAPRSTLHAPPLLFASGCFAPYALACLVLWLAGVFPRFVFWTISYASKYAGANPVAMAPEMLRSALNLVVGMDSLLWILPWAGALVMWQLTDGRWEIEGKAEVRGQKSAGGMRQPSALCPLPSDFFPSPRFFLTALLLCSFAAVGVGLYFRQHYFILLLPALALLCGVAVSRGWHLVRYDRSIELFLAVPLLGLFLIGSAVTLIGNGSVWFWMSPAAVVRETYGTTLFSEAIQVAEFIKQDVEEVQSPESKVQSQNGTFRTPHSALRTGTVAILGSEPEIYFYAHRRSATGYMYTYALMEAQPYALKMQEEMIAEIERSRPEYFVYVNDEFSWLRRPDSKTRIDEWWESYWAANLDLVKTIEIHGREGAAPTTLRKEILILKRRKG